MDSYDWVLGATLLALVMLGVVMVLSSSAPMAGMKHGDPLYYFKRQLLFGVLGAAVALLAMKASLELIKRSALPLLILSLGLLALVLLPPFGKKVGVAQRWLRTPVGTFQPSELAKLALVIFLCSTGTERKGHTFKDFLLSLAIVGSMVGLVLAEPDLGGGLFLGGLAVVLMFLYGWRLYHLALIPLLGLPAVGLFLIIEPYARRRVLEYLSFLKDPSQAPYQLYQSFVALARGGILGEGVGAGKQKLFYLPAAHTDFILANIGEELGLFGVMMVMALFGVVLFRGMGIALRHPDPFGRNLAAGLTLMIVLQAVVNMAVVLGMLPTKGLPLPFLSYGGSALVVEMVAGGLLLNLSRGVLPRRPG